MSLKSFNSEDSDDSEAAALLNELQHIGGQLHGWNYCAACSKTKYKLLDFSSCEHRMCVPCLEGQSKSTALPCPACGKISELQETSKRLLRIISHMNKIPQNQPESDQLNCTKTNGNNVADVTTNTTPRPGRILKRNKRNVKGETELQIACIANDLAKVKKLIADGADVNAQDNTGWTSLHESAFYGYYDIAAALLEAGALVDVPGEMNTTPLHDAVFNNKPEVAKLLINYGANTNSRNSKGQRPIDLTKEKEMKTLLATASVSPKVQESARKRSTNSAVWDASRVLLMAADQKTFEKQLKAFAEHFKVKISNAYSEKITHVVVMASDGVCKVSFSILQAILGGKTIVSELWIKTCLEAEKLLDPLPFEVKGTEKFPTSAAPERARANAALKSPGLFNGCNIYLRHTSCKYKDGDLSLSKDGFVQLIRLGGGKVLTREPKTDGETETNVQMPFHAATDGPLANCSHYIIRWAGDKRIQYNMKHVKTLPVEWFIESIENFRLLDSSGYI